MVHSLVIVALDEGLGGPCTDGDAPPALRSAMAPFDLDREVDPYPDYTEFQSRPADFWAVKYLRARFGFSVPDEELTWDAVAEAYNRDLVPADGEPPILFDGVGRPYFASTFNPRGEWDYWLTGGRWKDYFHVRPGAGDDPLLVLPNATAAGTRAAGGPKGALDLASMRESAAREAELEWDRFQERAAELPPALGWSSFARLVSADFPRQRAEEDYRSQPLVDALFHTDLGPVMDYALDAPGASKEGYIEGRRARAVPGAALLTLEGEWINAPFGGWIGSTPDIRSAESGYRSMVNAYIDALPDGVRLIAVDAHS
ncbi:hypothetical protein [Nocardiopsis chromatogenes]|uniref:hypothetical protein n=1 Tax=Nocardiopsis chromatogenes TaxID=280239 RepID=UPI00036A22D7|nr:hypothetical protein [Nocardiopsis chromatogenes]